MAAIQRTAEFDNWLKSLRDTKARAKVLVRIERLGLGNPGDVAPIGAGCSEMRIDFGPGYRVYFKKKGDTITLLLGGNKSAQQRDIERAKAIVRDLEE